MDTPPHLPALPTESGLSLAGRLARQEDWRGVLEAIRLGQWAGFGELTTEEVVDALLLSAVYPRQQPSVPFPDCPWPIDKDTPWPTQPVESGRLALIGWMISQSAFDEGTLARFRRHAIAHHLSPLAQQFATMEGTLDVWTDMVDAHSPTGQGKRCSWFGELASRNATDLLDATLTRYPALVSQVPALLYVNQIKRPDFLDVLVSHGVRFTPESLKTMRVHGNWSDFSTMDTPLRNRLPEVVWIHADLTLDDQRALSRHLQEKALRRGRIQEAIVWHGLIAAAGPGHQLSPVDLLSALGEDRIPHDGRMRFLRHIQTINQGVPENVQRAFFFCAWLLMGGRPDEDRPTLETWDGVSRHGLEPSRHFWLSDMQGAFLDALRWVVTLDLSREAHHNGLSRRLLGFAFSPVGRHLLAPLPPEEERALLDALCRHQALPDTSQFPGSPAWLRDGVASLFDADRCHAWIDRHGNQALSFWMDLLGPTPAMWNDEARRLTTTRFLVSLLQAGATFGPTDAELVDRFRDTLENWSRESLVTPARLADIEGFLVTVDAARLDHLLKAPDPGVTPRRLRM
jgi:hypothetical protein